MRFKTKCIIAGGVMAGTAVMVGVTVAIRVVRRQTKRVLKRRTRRVMADVLKMQGEDFVPGGELGMSVFRRHIDRLDLPQLVALFALVQVGYFIKASGIDPLHPNKEEIQSAVKKYVLEERLAPSNREGLLSELDTSDAYDALTAAFKVLVKE